MCDHPRKPAKEEVEALLQETEQEARQIQAREELRSGPDQKLYTEAEFAERQAKDATWIWDKAGRLDKSNRPPWRMSEFFERRLSKAVTSIIAPQCIHEDSELCAAYVKALGWKYKANNEEAIERLANLLRSHDVALTLAKNLLEQAWDLADVGDATGEALNDKYANQATFKLSFGGTSVFNGGLEPRIGSPKPNIFDAIAREHCLSSSATVLITTGNYGITTNALTEFLYSYTICLKDILTSNDKSGSADQYMQQLLSVRKLVFQALGKSCKDNTPTSNDESIEELLDALPDQWPAETQNDSHPRDVHGTKNWLTTLTELNAKLSKKKEKQALLEEAFMCHLYTGPLFMIYNGVCRGGALDPDDSVPAFMKDNFRKMCMGTDGVLNRFPTSVHTLKSGITKFSKLSKAEKVMRGMSGGLLPEQFWNADSDSGVKGGVEYGFMSTTTNRKVAMTYARGKGAGTLLEMQTGMIDRGADLSWVSQYPHEKEICFPPLTSLEVLDTKVEKGVLVVPIRLNVNLTEGTIDEVIGKRKKVACDLIDNLKTETSAEMHDFEGVDEAFKKGILETSVRQLDNISEKSADEFNVDTIFLRHIKHSLDIRQAVSDVRKLADPKPTFQDPATALQNIELLFPGGEGLVGNMPEKFRKLQTDVNSLKESMRLLEDTNDNLRQEAAEALGHLGVAAGTQVVEALCKAVEKDRHVFVRMFAAQALGRMGAAAGPRAAEALCESAENDPNAWVRSTAASALGKMGASVDARAIEIVCKVAQTDTDCDVRRVAVEALCQLQTIAGPRRAELLREVAETDTDPNVKQAARQALEAPQQQ